jgi:hypothetical protein
MDEYTKQRLEVTDQFLMLLTYLELNVSMVYRPPPKAHPRHCWLVTVGELSETGISIGGAINDLLPELVKLADAKWEAS